jgi:hypothetical protein
MALKLRRGTNSGRTAITPAEGEPIYTTDTKELYVGDGTTAGGIKITGAAVTDGDKGDITVSSSGATWTVDNDAVTYAKIQNVSAASKLLGRGDSSSGDVQEITLGTGLTMTGTTLAASGGGALGAPTYVVTKTANETVTSSTTLQDDDHLYQALTANKTYIFNFNLLFDRTDSSGTPGYQLAVAGNSQGSWNFFENGANYRQIADGTTVAFTNSHGITQGIPVLQQIRGVVNLTSNFTLKLRWCQGSSNATGSIILAKSQLIIWEVA